MTACTDGDFSEADRTRLNELLAAGPEQRRCFITYMDVHSRLAWEGGRRENDECTIINDGLSGRRETRPDCAPIHQASIIIPHLPLPGPLVSYCFAALFLSVAVAGAWMWKPAGGDHRPPQIVGQGLAEEASASPPLAIVNRRRPWLPP